MWIDLSIAAIWLYIFSVTNHVPRNFDLSLGSHLSLGLVWEQYHHLLTKSLQSCSHFQDTDFLWGSNQSRYAGGFHDAPRWDETHLSYLMVYEKATIFVPCFSSFSMMLRSIPCDFPLSPSLATDFFVLFVTPLLLWLGDSSKGHSESCHRFSQVVKWVCSTVSSQIFTNDLPWSSPKLPEFGSIYLTARLKRFQSNKPQTGEFLIVFLSHHKVVAYVYESAYTQNSAIKSVFRAFPMPDSNPFWWFCIWFLPFLLQGIQLNLGSIPNLVNCIFLYGFILIYFQLATMSSEIMTHPHAKPPNAIVVLFPFTQTDFLEGPNQNRYAGCYNDAPG